MADADRVIAEASAALAAAEPDPETILLSVVDVLTRNRPAIWIASLMTKDPDVTRVIGRYEPNAAIAGYVEGMQRRGGLPSAPVSSRVIESGEPLFIPRIPAKEFIARYLDQTTINELETNPFPTETTELGVIVVPMRARGTTVGTLGMFLPDSTLTLDRNDVAWLQLVADQTALAVQNVGLYEDARTRLEKINAAQDVIRAIRSAQDATLALKIIVHRVSSVLGVDACDVLTIDETDKVLVGVASTGFLSTPMAEFRLALDNPLLNQALDGHHVEDLRSSTVLDQVRRRSLFAREGFREYAAFPLASGSRRIGVLEIFHRSELNPDSEWFAFLEGMADLAAIAVESRDLREKVMLSRPQRTGLAPNLNPTEMQILRLVAEGNTNREIAAQVHLSQSTIKFHMRQILDKTGTANRTDLTRRATREGWI